MRLPILNNLTITSDLITALSKLTPVDKVNATLRASSISDHKKFTQNPNNNNDAQQLSEHEDSGGKIDVYA